MQRTAQQLKMLLIQQNVKIERNFGLQIEIILNTIMRFAEEKMMRRNLWI